MLVDLGILFTSLPASQVVNTPYTVLFIGNSGPNAQQLQESRAKEAGERSRGIICLTISDLINSKSSYRAKYLIQRNDGGIPRFGRPGEWWLMSAEECAEMFTDGHIDEIKEFEEQEDGDQVFWDEEGAVEMAASIFDAVEDISANDITETASTASDTNPFTKRIIASNTKIANIKGAFKNDEIVEQLLTTGQFAELEKIQNEFLQKSAHWATEEGLEIGGTAILMSLQPKITVTGEQKHGVKIVENGSDKN